MNTSVSKAEFARKMKRSKSCVTKWIKGGKISSAALRSDGTIWFEQAERDLAASLAPSQQVIQAAPILPTSAGVPLTPTLPPPVQGDVDTPQDSRQSPSTTRPVAPQSDRELDLARRAKADADRAEYDAESARRKLAVEEGRWMDAEAASKEWTRTLAEVVGGFEVFLASTLARDTADLHGLDMKVVSVRFREMFRKYRATLSEETKQEEVPLIAAE